MIYIRNDKMKVKSFVKLKIEERKKKRNEDN